jgi:allantoate deiminase
MQRIDELASISENPVCITRLFGTDAFVKARDKVVQWMQQAGLQTRVDNMGNARGKLSSTNPQAKTLVIASHIDTVINAGKFDGPLGVVMGLDIVEHFIQQKTPLPFHIELIAFSDEEGVRFHTTYLGSKVVAGTFDKNLLIREDANGIPLQQVLESMGCRADQLAQDAIAAEQWLGYFEIHIEQGPVLYEKNISVGIVTAIAGQNRIEVTFTGEAGHAGTVPMHMRNDALCAAADFILEAEQFATTHPVLATVGKLQIDNAASNVIPGKVTCTLDLRSADASILTACHNKLETIATNICQARHITMHWNLVQQSLPVTCDVKMNSLLEQAITEAGHEVIQLISGAGHDAVAISAVSPVAMLFVRCFKGISHNPLENAALKDIAAAVEVSTNFINHLIKTYNQG